MPQLEPAIENSHVITITPQGVGVPGPPAGFSWTKVTADKCKMNSEKGLLQTLSWTAAGCTAPGGTCSGGGSMNETAEKVTSNGQGLMRKTDNGICNGMAQMPSAPPQATTCKVEITDGGQVKVKAT